MGKAQVIGSGAKCPKCSRIMQRCQHKEGWKPKAFQPYYFRYWDKCRECRHVQHYEIAKVRLAEKAKEQTLFH